MRRYNPREIEPKWQAVWDKTKLYEVDTTKDSDKFYVIPMLPYTSGDLHIGHWYNFGPTDTVTRWQRMRGHRVLHTNGFDAFGLPAENAAIKNKVPPAEWTRQNIARMTEQLKTIGASYDWTKFINTSDPNYYRWTQWLFLKLFEKGLAYRAKAIVNWCLKDQTVLANEQVVGEKNVCERCGTPVVQKEMEQWFFKITDYAELLLKDLEEMDWPDRVKTMQKNWIGRSRGVSIEFEIVASATSSPSTSLRASKRQATSKVQVFTTRPDTVFGATYLVLAPEHPLASKLAATHSTSSGQASNEQKVKSYVDAASRKTELERKADEKNKTGVFSGSYAINPATKEKVPIWIADYVLMSYGTGAIMAVPAHDERDHTFAKKYSLPIKKVIEPIFIVTSGASGVRKELPFVERNAIVAIVKHWSEDKYLGLKWKKVAWGTWITGGAEKSQMPEESAIAEIIEETGYQHPVLKQVLSPVHGQFYHVPKKENRYAHFSAFYFELADSTRTDISETENDIHEIVWLSPKAVKEFLTPESHIYNWDELRQGSRPYEDEGVMVDSGKYDGLDSAEAREKITADLVKQGVANEETQYRLRDWLISRQRYWGAPIPIVYCPKDGIVAAPESDLPVLLPENVEFEPTGQSPLKKLPGFVNTTCPKCGGAAKRETDTMDTFVDSSWYFLRYPNPDYGKGPYNPSIVNKWAPVDHYIGGIEHAILHLMYARFITMFLHDHHGLAFEEPFKKLSNQGIILGPDGQKMSKSRGNVVSPDQQVNDYGADSLRLYLMFMGPYDQGGPYSLGGIAGTRRFLDRVWTLVQEYLDVTSNPSTSLRASKQQATSGHPSTALGAGNSEIEAQIARTVHKTIKKVSQDLEELGFNTAIAALMEAVNEFYKIKSQHPSTKLGAGNFELAHEAWQDGLTALVQILAPFAPHIAEELWAELGNKTSVHVSPWPTWDEKLVKEELVTLAVQVNGKVRAEITVPADIDEAGAIEAAKAEPKIAALLKSAKVLKAIYVPGRLVSLVVK